jgi:hypothetical protein
MFENTDRQPDEVAVPVRVRGKALREVKRPPTELELLAEISAKLDNMIAVLAAQGKDRDTQIDILSTAGCDSAFIGSVIGITAGAVRKYQSRRRGRGADEELARPTSS